MGNFTNGHAIITGASSGIGKEIAILLAAQGCNVSLVARRLPLLKELKAELETTYNIKALAIKADLTSATARKKVVSQAIASDLGPVTLLVNNAGMADYQHFDATDWERIQMTIDLNAVAPTHMTHLVVQHMLEHNTPGHILNIGSIASLQATVNFAVYGGTKSYLQNWSEAIGMELKAKNIAVRCLLPGGTITDFSAHAGQHLKQSAQKFMSSAKDVAQAGLDSFDGSALTVVEGAVNKVHSVFTKFAPRRAASWVADFAMKQNIEK